MAQSPQLHYDSTTITLKTSQPLYPNTAAKIIQMWDKLTRDEMAKIHNELGKTKYYELKQVSYNSPFFIEYGIINDVLIPVTEAVLDNPVVHELTKPQAVAGYIQAGGAFIGGAMVNNHFSKANQNIQKSIEKLSKNESTVADKNNLTQQQLKEVRGLMNSAIQVNGNVVVNNNYAAPPETEEPDESPKKSLILTPQQCEIVTERAKSDIILLENRQKTKKLTDVKLVVYSSTRQFVEDETVGDRGKIVELGHRFYPIGFSHEALKQQVTENFYTKDFVVDATVHYKPNGKVDKYIISYIKEVVDHVEAHVDTDDKTED